MSEEPKNPKITFGGEYRHSNDDAPGDVMIGLPVAESPTAPIRNAKQFPCSRCKRMLWVSPSGQEQIERAKMVILCMPCAYQNAKEKGGDITIMTPPRESLIKDLIKAQNKDN